MIKSGAAVAIALVALALLLQRQAKVPEPALVGVAAVIGIIAPR